MRLPLLFTLLLSLVATALAQSSPPSAAAPTAPSGYLPRTYVDPQGGKHPFFVFVPKTLPTAARPPVMLFLHGSGERGDNNVDQLMAGIGPAIWKRKATFPFIVVLPQCRAGSGWLADGDDAKRALGMLKQIQAEFGTDPDRVVLTGLSMGGSGTWSIAATDPTAWSAIVPMCSRPAVANARAFTDARLPIWNFCGDQDRPETVEANRAMAAALTQAGSNAKYTEYPGVGHNCWDSAYGTDELYTWMLAQSKSANRAAAAAAVPPPSVANASARVAAGEKQLKEAAEDEAERLAALEEEKKNPKPKFMTAYGSLKEAEAVPDFTAQAPDGSAVKFSELTKGKTTVFMTWTAGSGIPDAALAFTDGWARRYADQGVLFVALGAFGSRADFDKWHAANSAKVSFPLLFDPAGATPRMAKDSPSDLTAAEAKAFMEAARAHYGKVIPVVFCGGGMAPTPHSTVIDAQGKFVGFYLGAGPQTAESLGNLLLRAGIKLRPSDMPAKVFTVEETRVKPPEAKVEMLKVGALAPDFPATDAAGKEVKISDFRGKVVVLDFWATWCGPCLASMPHTQEVAAHYKDQGVVVLASCTNDARKKFDTWVKRNQAQFPDIIFSHDPQERGPDRASHKLYGVDGIPQQFIFDRDGRLVALVTGYLKGEALLDAALAKAGIKVDPALLAKAAEDMKRREAAR